MLPKEIHRHREMFIVTLFIGLKNNDPNIHQQQNRQIMVIYSYNGMPYFYIKEQITATHNYMDKAHNYNTGYKPDTREHTMTSIHIKLRNR